MVAIPGAAENQTWSLSPAEALTRGPRHHFFGYYDKACWDGSGRYVACLETEFIDRPPTAADGVTVGIIDREDDNRWRPLARTRAWNWQQGTMLHWLPVGHATGHAAQRQQPQPTPQISYNDRLEPGEAPECPSPLGWHRPVPAVGRFVSIIRDATTGAVVRTLPLAIYALSRDGRQAVSLNFARLQHQRPGYGYPGVADPWERVEAPPDDGIYWMDVETGEHRLIISLAQVAALAPDETFAAAIHRFNHLQFSPDDQRFIFLHRWQGADGIRHTRMLTARPDGSDIAIVGSHGMVSHFDWRDSTHILAWGRHRVHGERYFVYRDRVANQVEVLGEGVLTEDGHCSYSPDGRWLLTDTYPRQEPYRRLLLWDLQDYRRVDIGQFYSPPVITGEIRCDLHPRWNRDGTQVCFDSVHEGHRQVYVTDVSKIVR